MDKIINSNIKKLRENFCLTQMQISKYLGVDQSLVARIEKGDRSIKISQLQKLADLYGCDLNDLLSNNNVEPKIKLAFRAGNLEDNDMYAIANIKKIALNIREMENILKNE